MFSFRSIIFSSIYSTIIVKDENTMANSITWKSQTIWVEIHLTRYLDQQLGLCIANGSKIGPLNVKPYDSPFLCG